MVQSDAGIYEVKIDSTYFDNLGRICAEDKTMKTYWWMCWAYCPKSLEWFPWVWPGPMQPHLVRRWPEQVHTTRLISTGSLMAPTLHTRNTATSEWHCCYDRNATII